MPENEGTTIQRLNNASLDDCVNACNNDVDCAGFARNINNETCYLKQNRDEQGNIISNYDTQPPSNVAHRNDFNFYYKNNVQAPTEATPDITEASLEQAPTEETTIEQPLPQQPPRPIIEGKCNSRRPINNGQYICDVILKDRKKFT